MTKQYSDVVETARQYYNSEDADNFYYHIWGGEDIHIGLYDYDKEPIAIASRRTVKKMTDMLDDLNYQSKIIDLGSGYGGSARFLAKTFGCHVTALNLSETENARNRSTNKQQGVAEHINVVDGSFEQIPVDDESFDVAWSQDAILHSGYREQVIAEIYRVLKPGGQLIFTDPMQADDCPEGVLQPVLDRIHLSSLGSFAFYRQTCAYAGFNEKAIVPMTDQLITHYARVKEELDNNKDCISGKVSEEYIERMLIGLDNWIDAGKNGYLSWGIMHFVKP